jgi:AraC-like DNA-binding protein
LRGALMRIVDYFAILQDAAEVKLEQAGDDACFSYRILDPDIWPRRQDALFTLGIFAKIIRGCAGATFSDAELCLEGGQDGLKPDQLKSLGLKCGFRAETNMIRFPARLLERPMLTPAAQAQPNHARLNRQVALRRRRLAAALRVKTLIFQEIQEGEFSQDCVAQRLGMSSRTLRRKLGEEGVSFQKLLDECRMRLAAFEFQTRPETSIAQTALRLGYSEHSTFTRAFVRWWGVPPQRFIRQGQDIRAA